MMEWIKTREQEPPIGHRVLCGIYSTDYLVLEEGETMKQCLDRNRREIKRIEIGYLDDDGWTGSDGYPMIIYPTVWAELPELPEWDEVWTDEEL